MVGKTISQYIIIHEASHCIKFMEDGVLWVTQPLLSNGKVTSDALDVLFGFCVVFWVVLQGLEIDLIELFLTNETSFIACSKTI
jgi:hypothetical protein